MNEVLHVRAEQFLVLHSFLFSIPGLGRESQPPTVFSIFDILFVDIISLLGLDQKQHKVSDLGTRLVADLNLMRSALKPEIFRVQIKSTTHWEAF